VVVVAVVLVATGVFAFHKLHDSSGTSDLEWVKSVFQDQSMFSFTIYYCIAVMSAIGCVLWASYTAYGMAALPLSMMRGFLSDETNDEETQTLLDQERSIQSRAARTGERLSRRDMRALQRLRRDAEAAAAEASPQPPVPDAILSRLILVVEPFYRCRANCVGRVVSRDTCSRLIGFIFALVSLLLAASWITGARAACCIRAPAPTPEKGIYDSLSHSSCGLKCGFMIDKPTKGSPVDAILLAASIFFPLDFVLLTFIVTRQKCSSNSGVFTNIFCRSSTLCCVLFMVWCLWECAASASSCLQLKNEPHSLRACCCFACICLCLYLRCSGKLHP
jgi:LMBR1 domain-containing protein 1